MFRTERKMKYYSYSYTRWCFARSAYNNIIFQIGFKLLYNILLERIIHIVETMLFVYQFSFRGHTHAGFMVFSMVFYGIFGIRTLRDNNNYARVDPLFSAKRTGKLKCDFDCTQN